MHHLEARALVRRAESQRGVRDREGVRAERVKAEELDQALLEPLHQIVLVGRGREERDEQGHDLALGLGEHRAKHPLGHVRLQVPGRARLRRQARARVHGGVGAEELEREAAEELLAEASKRVPVTDAELAAKERDQESARRMLAVGR